MRRIAGFVFDIFEVYVAAAAFAVLIISVFVQVFMRYVLIMPSPELFEVSIYSFVWIIYLGAALACRYNQHVRFDILHNYLPPKLAKVQDIVFHLASNVILLILVYPAFRYTIEMYHIKASALRIPWTFLLGVYPIFIVLVLIHNFTAVVRNIKELLGKAAREKEAPPWQ